MGKISKVKAVGDNFVLLRKGQPSRSAVQRLSGKLNRHGKGSFGQFLLRYSKEAQFGDWLGRRFRTTLQLFRFAHYYAFVFAPGPLTMGVGGAVVQHGSGNSRAPRSDHAGRTVYNGWEASHVRLGTFDINGEPISVAWPARVLELAGAHGIATPRIESVFPHSCRLANLAMMLDAMTDQTDALLNRVFGQLETEMHKVLRALAPASVPGNVQALQVALDRLNERWPILATKGMRHFAKARRSEIARDPVRDLQQEPVGWDGAPPMFGSESKILDALLDQIENPGSDLWQSLNAVAASAKNDTACELEEVVAARSEVLGGDAAT